MVVRMGRLLDATLVRRASYAWVRSGSPRAFSRVQGREQDSTVLYLKLLRPRARLLSTVLHEYLDARPPAGCGVLPYPAPGTVTRRSPRVSAA